VAYRIFSGVIVLFWCVMTFLLVRVIVSPESAGLLDVPVSHVVKMVFLGGQTSDLSIYQNGRTTGSFSLRPETPLPGGGRTLLFSGNLALALPFMARQRVVWQGALRMDDKFQLGPCQGVVGVRDSPNSLRLEYSPDHPLRCQIKGANGGGTFALDDAGAAEALHALGVDATAVEGVRKSVGKPEITARRSFLKVRNEKIEAYQVAIRQGDAPLAEIYVSQLGQILFVHTSFGYTLGSEDIAL